MKKDEGGDQPLTNPFGSTTGATTVGPVGTGTGTASATGDPTGEPSAAPSETATSPQPTSKPTSTPQPTGKPTVDPSKACDACLSAASGGNIGGAAAAYNRCSDAGKKAQCSQAARNKAPSAARAAALNGKCAQAKGTIAAARAMGADSPALNGALNGSSCK
jgi:hypothetical protein